MAKVTVYSKFPIAQQFFNNANNHTIILKGMNGHTIEVPPNTPMANQIDEEDWQFIKDKYGDRKSYFDKLNGDMFYVADTKKEAKQKLSDSKAVIDDKFIVGKQKKITDYKQDEIG